VSRTTKRKLGRAAAARRPRGPGACGSRSACPGFEIPNDNGGAPVPVENLRSFKGFRSFINSRRWWAVGTTPHWGAVRVHRGGPPLKSFRTPPPQRRRRLLRSSAPFKAPGGPKGRGSFPFRKGLRWAAPAKAGPPGVERRWTFPKGKVPRRGTLDPSPHPLAAEQGVAGSLAGAAPSQSLTEGRDAHWNDGGLSAGQTRPKG